MCVNTCHDRAVDIVDRVHDASSHGWVHQVEVDVSFSMTIVISCKSFVPNKYESN